MFSSVNLTLCRVNFTPKSVNFTPECKWGYLTIYTLSVSFKLQLKKKSGGSEFNGELCDYLKISD